MGTFGSFFPYHWHVVCITPANLKLVRRKLLLNYLWFACSRHTGQVEFIGSELAMKGATADNPQFGRDALCGHAPGDYTETTRHSLGVLQFPVVPLPREGNEDQLLASAEHKEVLNKGKTHLRQHYRFLRIQICMRICIVHEFFCLF